MTTHSSILSRRIPMNSMKRQNDRILKEELPRLAGAQYATGDQWRNNSRKNSVVSDSATPWTIQSMEFSRPEYWSG